MLTFDVEMDAPPYMSSWRGVSEGLPLILEILDYYRVKATFFTIGILAEVNSKALYSIIDKGHELACHGYDHRRLDKIPLAEARDNIRRCVRALREYSDILSFRAPNLKLPPQLLNTLVEEGIIIDSSIAWYKPPFYFKPKIEARVYRIPASYPSSILRLPWVAVKALFAKRINYVILTHPWEYISLKASLRPDLTLGVGSRVGLNLARLIGHLKNNGYIFLTMRDSISKLKSHMVESS
ncbi:MAG: polysaccharide deacetylase family protein [Acidilobaceae archaeon]